MTKSKGVRAMQRRREELLRAELTLRRVLCHLCALHSLARQCCRDEEVNHAALTEYLAIDAAFQIVRKLAQRARAASRKAARNG